MLKNKNPTAVIFCGHGSRDKRYKKNLLSFKRKIKNSLDKFSYFHCFIEVDSPSIDDCLEKIIKKFNKIFFFPLLLFQGDHYENDVKKKIQNFNKKNGNKIVMLNKISLKNEILKIYSNFIKKKIEKDRNTYLITSCSISKNKKVKSELLKYTNYIKKKANISKSIYCQFGREDQVFKTLNKESNIKGYNFILHPIYFFDGYLYTKVCEKFQSHIKDIKILKPLSFNKEIFLLIRNRLIGV